MPYTPGYPTMLGSNNPDPAGPSALVGTNGVTFPDRCQVLRYDASRVLFIADEIACKVLATKSVREPVVAGSVEAQATVVIEAPYAADIHPEDLLLLLESAGQVVEGVRFRVIGTDKPHADGLKQSIRTVRTGGNAT